MFIDVKACLKKNALAKGVYRKLKDTKEKIEYKRRFHFSGQFIDRSKNRDILCIVLAGYKDYLYTPVFSRLKQYAIPNMDICVVSSGKHSDKLMELCEVNEWSYLSTKHNNVSLIQNIAIKFHPDAQYIFKLDEDIFIPKDYFKNMLRAMEHAHTGYYSPGVIAPLIPVNGYGYMRILEKLNKMDIYRTLFCGGGSKIWSFQGY